MNNPTDTGSSDDSETQASDRQADLLDETDEKYLRLFFENIKRYRADRPESSKPMLQIVSMWAQATALDSETEAQQVIEEAQKIYERGSPQEKAFRQLLTFLPTDQSHGNANLDNDNQTSEPNQEV